MEESHLQDPGTMPPSDPAPCTLWKVAVEGRLEEPATKWSGSLSPFVADQQRLNAQRQLCCPFCWLICPTHSAQEDTRWAKGPALNRDRGQSLSWGSLPHSLFPEIRRNGCFHPEGWGQRSEPGEPAGGSCPVLASNPGAGLLFSDTLRFWLEDPQMGLIWPQPSSE